MEFLESLKTIIFLKITDEFKKTIDKGGVGQELPH